jgi:alpha-tubulin suppressor-like RCC1 family protein
MIKCWGSGFFGQLATGARDDIGDDPNEMGKYLKFTDLGKDLKVEKISVGGNHNCASFTSKKIKCWGLNMYGQLGLGDGGNRGDWKGEVGDGLPYLPIATGVTVISISLGHDHTCILLSTNGIRCFGVNGYGQLGYGDIANRGNAKTNTPDLLPDVALLHPSCASYTTKDVCQKDSTRCSWFAITAKKYSCVDIPICGFLSKATCVAGTINKFYCIYDTTKSACKLK